MPRGDRTGPRGTGPMTGRATGYCTGYPMPGYADPVGGRAFGYRGGGGRGWRNCYYATGLPGWARAGYPPAANAAAYTAAPQTPEQEATFLRAEADRLKAALGQIEQRLCEIETDK